MWCVKLPPYLHLSVMWNQSRTLRFLLFSTHQLAFCLRFLQKKTWDNPELAQKSSLWPALPPHLLWPPWYTVRRQGFRSQAWECHQQIPGNALFESLSPAFCWQHLEGTFFSSVNFQTGIPDKQTTALNLHRAILSLGLNTPGKANEIKFWNPEIWETDPKLQKGPAHASTFFLYHFIMAISRAQEMILKHRTLCGEGRLEESLLGGTLGVWHRKG